MNRLTDRVLEATSVSAELRVARRLSDLAANYDEGTLPVAVPVTQVVLAGLADTTRATANRVLRKLAAQGIVRLGRSRVEVVDAAQLDAYAHRG